MSEKILTKHPKGKSGVNIDKEKYEIIKDQILDLLKKQELTYTQLSKKIEEKIGDSFEGSVGWYTVTVKLDLEARREIERVPNTSPEKLRLSK